MAPVHHKTSARHSRAICDANKIVVTRLYDDAEIVVHRVHHKLDPLTGLDDTIDLNVSFDGSWMTQGYKAQYGNWHWLCSRSRHEIGAQPCSDVAVLSAMCLCQHAVV